MTTIVVSIRGGLVQHVANIPDGVHVEVRDYDMDDVAPDRGDVCSDEDGKEYIQTCFIGNYVLEH